MWKLDPQNGNTREIPDTKGGLIPTCAGEGDSIFYWGQTGGTSYVFKAPFSGGTPVRFSDRVAISPPFLSLDGKHLIFATPMKDGSVGGAVLSADTGKLESEIIRPANVRPEREHVVLDATTIVRSRIRICGAVLRTYGPSLRLGMDRKGSSLILLQEKSGPAHFRRTENMSRSPMAHDRVMRYCLRPRNRSSRPPLNRAAP